MTMLVATPTTLVIADRCDSCSAQAYVQVSIPVMALGKDCDLLLCKDDLIAELRKHLDSQVRINESLRRRLGESASVLSEPDPPASVATPPSPECAGD